MRLMNSKSLATHRYCQRHGVERRKFNYSVYLPERRSGKERRQFPPQPLDDDMKSQVLDAQLD